MKIGARIILFNVRMRERRKELGLTQMQLSELCGTYPMFISKVETLQPLRASWKTKQYLNNISNILECDFDYLFPKDYIEAMAKKMLPGIRNMIFVKDISFDELPPSVPDLLLPPPENNVFENFMKEAVIELLEYVKPKEREVLELRYGIFDGHFYSREEIGQKMGVTRERIRQIEEIALCRLRHPKLRKKVKDYLGSRD